MSEITPLCRCGKIHTTDCSCPLKDTGYQDVLKRQLTQANQRIAELETIDIKVINKVILEIGVYLMRDCIDDDGYENLAEALLPNWHDALVQATYKYQDEALQPKGES